MNYDMVSEVKVQTANFGADLANGPVVLNAVTKAGGTHFHGDLYTYLGGAGISLLGVS